MIELFKTHCKLPDGSIGEVCKKVSTGWLVCSSQGWWECEEEWVLENKCCDKKIEWILSE